MVPPDGYATWIEYAIATMDTRSLSVQSGLDGEEISREAIKTAAKNEYNNLLNRPDSTKSTLEHIALVGRFISQFIQELTKRSSVHDHSKLLEPEKSHFDQAEHLKGMVYGSEKYKASLSKIQVALDHHYAHNSHHPQYYSNGINGMNLIDLCEMFCDWSAATARHKNGSILESIKINKDRFGMSEQLVDIFNNTVALLNRNE